MRETSKPSSWHHTLADNVAGLYVFRMSLVCKLKWLLLAGAVLQISACQYYFAIQYSGFGSNIRLEFLDPGLFRQEILPTCISRLTVTEVTGDIATDTVVWDLKAAGRCTTLTGVDIGHVPNGFKQVINKLPLKAGHHYQAYATVDDDYRANGISERWFVCRALPQKGGYKNEYELLKTPASCLRR